MSVQLQIYLAQILTYGEAGGRSYVLPNKICSQSVCCDSGQWIIRVVNRDSGTLLRLRHRVFKVNKIRELSVLSHYYLSKICVFSPGISLCRNFS